MLNICSIYAECMLNVCSAGSYSNTNTTESQFLLDFSAIFQSLTHFFDFFYAKIILFCDKCKCLERKNDKFVEKICIYAKKAVILQAELCAQVKGAVEKWQK